jgi:replicative DNA helicase
MNHIDPITHRRIPYSPDQEKVMLGAIFRNNGEIIPYVSFLKPEHFYSPHHADIFASMLALRNNGEEISVFTVPKYMNDIDFYKKSDGAQLDVKLYLAVIATQPEELHPVAFARSIFEMYQRRKLADYCEAKALELAKENDPKELHKHADDLRDALEAMKIGQPDLFKHNRKTTEDIIAALHKGAPCYSTGFAKLDETMDGGLYAGKSYGIAARKKTGKTSFAATISYNLNEAGIDHLFVCGEMSANEIQQRILCRAADMWPSAFRTAYGKSQDCQDKLIAVLNRSPIHTFFQNAAGMTFVSLKQACRIAVEKKKVKGIIIDYWQLVGGKKNGQSTAEHLDEVAQWIADFSRQHDIFTLTMAQINQDGNTRGSEGIRLAFDQLYELHREDNTQPQTWLEMLETRYTKWANIGSEIVPGFMLAEKGTWFEAFS